MRIRLIMWNWNFLNVFVFVSYDIGFKLLVKLLNILKGKVDNDNKFFS